MMPWHGHDDPRAALDGYQRFHAVQSHVEQIMETGRSVTLWRFASLLGVFSLVAFLALWPADRPDLALATDGGMTEVCSAEVEETAPYLC